MSSRFHEDVALLRQTLDAELAAQIPAPARLMAEHLAQQFGPAVQGVLFYGSGLRDADLTDKILDYYVIVDGYRAAHGSVLHAALNCFVPPSVYYRELATDDGIVRAKVAVLRLSDMRHMVSQDCLNSLLWARFSQPTVIAWCRDEAARLDLADAVMQAVVTMVSSALPLAPPKPTPTEVWRTALDQTYAAELRSEPEGKSAEIVAAAADRYGQLTAAALRLGGWSVRTTDHGHLICDMGTGRRWWSRLAWLVRRFQGKFLSLLRLIRSAFTFSGGIDYLAWKIKRHSGVDIEIKDWMRRHPIFAGLVLFPKMRARGAFR